KRWLGTYRDLPEHIIDHLAKNQERNALIAQTYAKNKKRYGKTIIFAERWYQCEQLREFLAKRKVRAGAVYSHVDAVEATAAGRNRRDKNENAREIEAFRRNELDVLINVKMLTEGTDVPDVNTVFLTRQTTSNILLTQMVGRALRGPKFEGTEYAYIVSFIDNWKQAINWAEYDQLVEGPADEGITEYGKRPPLQLISIELVRRLARQMDSGINVTPAPFLTLMPIGWYRTAFDALVEDSEDVETVRDLVMVFEDDKDFHQKFIEHLKKQDLRNFASESIILDDVKPTIHKWLEQFFPQTKKRNEDELLKNLLDITRHVAQNNEAPVFFAFEERAHHDLDAVAKKFLDDKLNRLQEYEALKAEYHRPDRYWTTIYWSYDLFVSQYDACVIRILRQRDQSGTVLPEVSTPPESIAEREPSEEVKRQVKERDGYRCLCCGETNKRLLQIDHVAPSYYGGNNSLPNLQTLCKTCNNIKDISTLNFQIHKNQSVNSAPLTFPDFEMPHWKVAKDAEQWKRFLRRSINFFYQCSAVSSVMIGGKGKNYYEWHITLYEGNDPRWLKPHLKPLLNKIQDRIRVARYDNCIVERIIISAPNQKDVAWPTQSNW
ncbi:MAG: HNH endonuclease, partial [Thermoproteota archaeon]|nr:HNH endonuclease [Thermoproteota archaeon]